MRRTAPTATRPNDATASPTGHTAEEQEVFDEGQWKKARPQHSAGDPFTSKPIPKSALPDPVGGEAKPWDGRQPRAKTVLEPGSAGSPTDPARGKED